MTSIESALLTSLFICLLIQAVFFLYAVTFKSDKVTDLTYGLTFILITIYSLFLNNENSIKNYLLAFMITAWALRLITYLFYRILKIKRDKRFDGIRENGIKFAQFWLLQGMSVWIIMIPVIIFLNKSGTSDKIEWGNILGFCIWLIGLIIETIADLEKFNFKIKEENRDKWVSSGLWKYSRHPNYFGEILCWWGVFIYILNNLKGFELLSIVGPLFITFLIIFVSGIPILEKKYNKRYADDAEYTRYKKETSLLVLFPKFKR